jgi:hypothetical protein
MARPDPTRGRSEGGALIVATLVVSGAVSGCSLRHGLDVDLCAPPTIASQLTRVADGVLVYRGNEEVERAGTSCQGASDEAACQATLAQLKPTQPRYARERGPGTLVILLTNKGAVRRLNQTSAWSELEGIAPAARAQLWVEFKRSVGVLCGGKNAQQTAEGVRLLVSNHDGCFGGSDTLLLVKPEGEIIELESKSYPQTCVG